MATGAVESGSYRIHQRVADERRARRAEQRYKLARNGRSCEYLQAVGCRAALIFGEKSALVSRETASLQPRQLHANRGDARGSGAVVPDEFAGRS
jgi:hypothetical protein